MTKFYPYRDGWELCTKIQMFLCPSIDRSGAYCFTGVCLSVRLSICLLKTYPVDLTFSSNFHTIQDTMLIFSVQVAFDNTQLVRVISSRSRSNIKDTFLAPLAEGQRAIVIALCPLCVHPSVRMCLRP